MGAAQLSGKTYFVTYCLHGILRPMKYAVLLLLGSLLGPRAYAQFARGGVSVQGLCLKAREQLTEGKYAQARQTAKNAVKLNVQSAQAQSLLGQSEFALGNLPAAKEHLQKALKIDSALPSAHRALGATFLKQRQFKEAQGQFEAVLKSYPDDISCLYGLGFSLLSQNEPSQALKSLRKAHELNPSDADVLVAMLAAHLKLRQLSQATAVLGELNHQFAGNHSQQMQLAALLVHEGAYGLAIVQFKRILKAKPDSYELNYDLALAYHRAGKEDQAAKQIHKVLAQKDDPELENLLAAVEEKCGNYRQALIAYKRAANLQPGNEEYQLDYATELALHWNPNDALKIFAAEVKKFPNSASVWMGLGGSYFLVGKYNKAAEVLLRTSRMAPGNPNVYVLLGIVYDAAGPLQKPIKQRFRDYLKTHPSDALAHFFYGKILFDQGKAGNSKDFGEAQHEFDEAIALNPSLAEVRIELAKLLRMQGDTRAARTQLETAVKLDPGSSDAYYQLMEVYRQLGQPQKAALALQKFRHLKDEAGKNPGRKQVMKLLGGARQ